MNRPVKLILSIIICLFAGFLGSLANIVSLRSWYETLAKPAFNPPNWVFQPVWTTLFILMGVSLYLIWASKKKKTTQIKLFTMQLILNILWSVFFFGLRMPLLAFLDIVALLAAIILTIVSFNKISKTAGYLLIPYFLWVSFAAILNLAIVILN